MSAFDGAIPETCLSLTTRSRHIGYNSDDRPITGRRNSPIVTVMDDGGYQGGNTRGGKWGCAVAGLVGLPIFILLVLADALGDCAPDTPCHHGFWTMVVLPTLLAAVPVGLLVRWLVNRLSRNDR